MTLETRDATWSIETRDDGGRVMVARMVPYGEVSVGPRGPEVFDRGALRVPTDRVVPLTIDHGDGTLTRIGRLVASENRDDGAYGTFQISDTANGRDTHTLLRDGVVDAVSVGFIAEQEERRGEARALQSAELDHLAVVAKGQYQGAAPVAVRNKQEATIMADETTATDPAATDDAETRTAEPAEDLATAAQLAQTEDRVRSLQTLVEGLEAGKYAKVEDRATAGVLAHLIIGAQRGDKDADVELRALAKDTTTTAAGIVPDFYSNEVISVIDLARPFVADLATDPIGSHGMDHIYPKVTQKPAVGKQSAEHAEPASQQFTVGVETVTLDTFAGANDVAVQTIDRSTPAFLDAYYKELAGIYAQETEQEAEADVLGATGIGTSVLATTADLATTWSGLVAGAVNVAKGVKRMPDRLWASPDRWGQLADLVDADGRPVFPAFGQGPQNALGNIALGTQDGTVSNLVLRMCPNFATGTLLMGWSGGAATIESGKQQLRAIQVATVSWELGVYGYFATAVKYPAAFHSFTTS